MATTRLGERLLASLGKLQAAPICFERAQDVPKGGVLCAVPALLAFGLLRHQVETFSLPAGYYPIEAIFLSIAFLALARVKSVEALRYQPPGEWGKIIGLDRIPEVRTLRKKIGLLCGGGGEQVRQWSGQLAREWMEADPQSAGCLYVDGHIRVYNGSLTQLPRRYVARQRICLRGTTDYWVNAMDGQPFFVVTQAVDPGLRKVLEKEIIPRLLQEVPGQPTPEQLQADPQLARFTVIFDREGYSPELFARLWALRIAVISYRKFVQRPWSPKDFTRHPVRLVNGEEVEMDLAQRRVPLRNGLRVREIRRRTPDGHQTSIISTNYEKPLETIAATLFARWCQENFFQYMGQHYGLNRLVEYGTEPLPETTIVVNPAWRRKDQAVRRERAQLLKEQAQFGALTSPPQAQPHELIRFEQQKGQLLEQIENREQKLDQLKVERKSIPRQVTLKDLPKAQRFTQLSTAKKHFIDTIKLIAYRAETALVHIVREKLQREDDARALVRQVFNATVDLCPDLQQKILRVRLHQLTTPAHAQILEHLCAELTDTETLYPGAGLRLVFEPIGATGIP